MPDNRRLCFLIADGEHARVVEADADNTLRTIRSLDSSGIYGASHDLGSDWRKRGLETARSGSQWEAPRHAPHQWETTKFEHFVADEVGKEMGEGVFDRLVLIAPAHCLHEIEDALDARTASMLAGRLAKDLVKTPDYELSPHLREWLDASELAS